jgi:hypothetical protein
MILFYTCLGCVGEGRGMLEEGWIYVSVSGLGSYGKVVGGGEEEDVIGGVGV